MSIDPTDEDDSGDEQRSTGAATPGRKSPAHDGDGGDADNAIVVDGVQPNDRTAGDAVDGMVRSCFRMLAVILVSDFLEREIKTTTT